MSFDLNAMFDDPRFAEAVALFGATGQHNASLIDAAKTMQHMKQLKAQQEQMQFERQQAVQDMAHKEKRLTFDEKQLGVQADQHSASTAVSRLNAQTLAAQNKLKEDQDKRDKAMLRNLTKKFPKFAPILEGMAGEGGTEQPSAPSMVPQSAPETQAAPMSVQAPALEVPRGKYGTPVAILQGLAKTESSNNPLAIGPIIGYENGKPIRAEGLMQFLPNTTKMLHAEGIKFNPFKKEEAWDAADYYLAKLNKQHGGDWNKTLAAYGGFKTKDPTNYIQKVMGGSNEKQALAHSANQNAMTAVNPFAESQELQELGGMLSLINPKYGQAFDMMAKGAQPQKVEGGGMYQTPGGMVRVPLTPEQQAEEDRKAAVERRADEDQRIQHEKAEYEKTQRKAKEKEQAAETAQKEAAADEKRAKVDTEAKQRDQAKITAQSIINEMRKSYDTLDKRGGIVNSEKGLFNNLPAAVQSSAFGQQIQRITGTANQTERSNLEMARPLLLQSLAQALGMGVRQLDNVKEFEMYLKAATDPTMDVAANKQALDRLEQILTGKASLTIKTPDGEKTMTVEEFKKSAPAASDRSSQFKVIR